jgi:hypothetical protein
MGGVMIQYLVGGIWNGGVYPSYTKPVPKEAAWVSVVELFFTIPENADPGAYVSVYNGYMPPFGKGKTLFKDVDVHEIPPPVMQAILTTPSYRGTVLGFGFGPTFLRSKLPLIHNVTGVKVSKLQHTCDPIPCLSRASTPLLRSHKS